MFVASIGGIGVGALAGCSDTGGVSEEDYPDEELTVVVPFGAGGGTDTQYRGFKDSFEQALGAQTVVDNRPGASGREGFNHLSQQSADGYTVGVISIATGVLGEALFETQYSMENLTTIGTISEEFFSIITAPDRFKSMDDLANTDEEIVGASTGRGASSDFALVSILDRLNIDFRIVPFESGQELSTAVASGDADIGVTPPTAAAGLIDEGQLEFLFIDRPDQSSQFPDAPIREDVGFESPGISLELGMFGPEGVDDNAVETLETAIAEAVENEEYQEWADSQGLSVSGAGATETRDKVQEYTDLAERYIELRGEG